MTPSSSPRHSPSSTLSLAQSDENTPLLVNHEHETQGDIEQDNSSSKASRWQRWPSMLALGLLCLVIVIIMVFGFLLPQGVKEYATQALVFQPKTLSIDSFTDKGVIARIRGDVVLDASRVKNVATRNFGRLVTYIAKEVESGSSQVEVSLPDYRDAVLGTAEVPAFKFNIRNGHLNELDFLTNLQPGDKDVIGIIANDWVLGRVSGLHFEGRANVKIKSGKISLGTQTIIHNLDIDGRDIPSLPRYNISRLDFTSIGTPEKSNLQAKALLQVENNYPLDLPVPSLVFDIFVSNCRPEDPYIRLAKAQIPSFHLQPNEPLALSVVGEISDLPKEFLTVCPQSQQSPLDSLLGEYIQGEDATVYIRGSSSPSKDTPEWMSELISGLTVPIAFPGRVLGKLIKNFSLENVHFSLPDPSDDSDEHEIEPRISADIEALVSVPEEMNFPIGVRRVKAVAEVFYHDKKLGNLNLDQWTQAVSRPIVNSTTGHSDLEVSSHIDNAPLTVTDDDTFVDVIQGLLHSKEIIFLSVKADVDVALKTPLGEFVVRRIPAQGVVPVKPFSGANFTSLSPRVDDLKIISTSAKSLKLQAAINFTNPTPYSATIPYADVKILVNGTELGHATIRDAVVRPGLNVRIPVMATWDPSAVAGRNGSAVGRELLSQYISGFNTSLTLKTHKGSLPSHPSLGRALEVLEIEMPTPKLRSPAGLDGGDGGQDPNDDDKLHFIDDATMHLFSSTATFTLLSPLKYSTIYITSIDATAYYKGDAVGTIEYDDLLEVPPGASQTPKLPVSWSLDSVGYEAVRKALGGTLKLSTRATIGVQVGHFLEEVWYEGEGIGARVRI